jgi:hypothetical protein
MITSLEGKRISEASPIADVCSASPSVEAVPKASTKRQRAIKQESNVEDGKKILGKF